MPKKEVYTFLVVFWCILVLTYGTSSGVSVNWAGVCGSSKYLQDENDRNLKGVWFDFSSCGHTVYDLVYLVWDQDMDGIEEFDCDRQLDGDSIADSIFIGQGVFCNTPPCSSGGFSTNFTWGGEGDLDTFYVIALNDTTRAWATYYGTSAQHSPSLWEVDNTQEAATIICNANSTWKTDTEFPDSATFTGTSIAGNAEPGDRKVGMAKIAAVIGTETAIWNSIKVDNGPSAGCTNDDEDIDSVKIYREVSGAGFDPSDDLLIGEAEWGPGPPDGGTATVTFFDPETLTTTSVDYYIAFDIEASAVRSHCAAACIQNDTYFGISAPDCIDGNFPFCSGDAGLPVEISRFEAFAGDRMVTLEWTTQTEIDNRGFHIYRALSEDGVFSRVNQEMIPGAGNSSLPIDYEYIDRGLNNGTEYFYKLVSVTYGNDLSYYENVVSAMPRKEHWGRSADQTGLYGCSPNPFISSAQISFQLRDEAVSSSVSLQVYDVSGRLVRTLAQGHFDSGAHMVPWDGLDEGGKPVPSALYFCRLRTDEVISIMKVVKVD
ncbi:hypothetical protein E3J62_03685 [candidate division TA06 bacterium]|uniref:FlgD/Vpr Ig-like domain-containing protein n=1 Tax=candidate division TA06 bacterium TaxID=2250710 RepID=A0A523UVY5_UNCT6|nr:MAG: hypothetical protein E3J62_03685 [candidate division TA06 bacterium]